MSRREDLPQNSGIKPKDRIVAIDDEEVKSPGDVSLALLDKKAGDPVVVREATLISALTENLVVEVRLQE